MFCPKCNSNDIKISTNTYTKSVSRSLLWNIFMLCITAGLWLIWMLIRKRKERVIVQKIAVCQKCGNSWYL